MKGRLTLAPRSGSHQTLKAASHKVLKTDRLSSIQVSLKGFVYLCPGWFDCPSATISFALI